MEYSSTDIIEIMRVSAYLSTKGIPNKLLISWFRKKLNISKEEAQQRFNFAIKILEYSNLVVRKKDYYSIRTFIYQEEMKLRSKLETNGRDEVKLIQKLTKHIYYDLFDESNKHFRDLKYTKSLVSHLKVLINYLKSDDKTNLCLAYIAIGHYYCDLRKDYKKALQYYTKAEVILGKKDKLTKEEKFMYSRLLIKKGGILRDLNKEYDIEKYHIMPLEMQIKAFNKKEKDYPIFLKNTAILLSFHKQGIKKALKYYKEALKITNNTEDKIFYLETMSKIYKELCKTKEAQECNKRTQAVEQEKIFAVVKNIQEAYYC